MTAELYAKRFLSFHGVSSCKYSQTSWNGHVEADASELNSNLLFLLYTLPRLTFFVCLFVCFNICTQWPSALFFFLNNYFPVFLGSYTQICHIRQQPIVSSMINLSLFTLAEHKRGRKNVVGSFHVDANGVRCRRKILLFTVWIVFSTPYSMVFMRKAAHVTASFIVRFDFCVALNNISRG